MKISISALSVIGCFALSSLLNLAQAEPFDDLINQARQQLERGDSKSAFKTAQKAAIVKPSNYKAYYYLAMANLALDDINAAELAVASAANTAPDSAQASIAKLADAIKKQRKVLYPIPDVLVILACEGESVRKYGFKTTNEETEPFKEIYKINLTASTIDEWKSDRWSALGCENPSRPATGYIEWKHEKNCRVTDQIFSHYRRNIETQDSGQRYDILLAWEISRVTGELKIKQYFDSGTAEKMTGFVNTTDAKCEPTQEPAPKQALPVKF
jgi:tetratricopeptide (TPR) repeat protein